MQLSISTDQSLRILYELIGPTTKAVHMYFGTVYIGYKIRGDEMVSYLVSNRPQNYTKTRRWNKNQVKLIKQINYKIWRKNQGRYYYIHKIISNNSIHTFHKWVENRTNISFSSDKMNHLSKRLKYNWHHRTKSWIKTVGLEADSTDWAKLYEHFIARKLNTWIKTR
jgi:hypothetical protein